MTKIDINVGNAIQARRVELKLSIERLAQVSKISPDRLVCFEQGKLRPQPDELVKICECLSVSSSFFFRDWQSDERSNASPNQQDTHCGDKEA